MVICTSTDSIIPIFWPELEQWVWTFEIVCLYILQLFVIDFIFLLIFLKNRFRNYWTSPWCWSRCHSSWWRWFNCWMCCGFKNYETEHSDHCKLSTQFLTHIFDSLFDFWLPIFEDEIIIQIYICQKFFSYIRQQLIGT